MKKCYLPNPKLFLLFSFLFLTGFHAWAQAEGEPNNDFSTANTFAISGNATGSVCPDGDVDFFKIVLPKDGVYRIKIEATNAGSGAGNFYFSGYDQRRGAFQIVAAKIVNLVNQTPVHMTKEQLVEAISAHYDELNALNKIDNFYDYESDFIKLWGKMGREVLEKNISTLSGDRRKKTLTVFGELTIAKSHPFSEAVNGFQISPRMQQLMTYCGQLDSYEKSNEVLKEMLQVEVSETQIYRVTDFYGKAVEASVNEEPVLSPVKADEVMYAQADGSMILTREEGWSEVKVGRLFKSSDCLHADGKPGWISHSQYIAHLGSHKEFTKTLDTLVDKYGNLGNRLVFVSDGATWIKNWIEDAFPKAISILDYYHVCEHLHEFSSSIFTDKTKEKCWTDKQKEWLLKGEVKTVITNIKRIGKNTEKANQLISYYTKNKERMKYQDYLTIGCGIIGSGAIESAHRTLVQKRMKQSGQRWSCKGAQNMLNLRVVRKNNDWNKIIELTKVKLKVAA